jgi:hypothetical protein
VGAWPTFECEVTGQSEAIATNLTLMAGLKVPIVTGTWSLNYFCVVLCSSSHHFFYEWEPFIVLFNLRKPFFLFFLSFFRAPAAAAAAAAAPHPSSFNPSSFVLRVADGCSAGRRGRVGRSAGHLHGQLHRGTYVRSA